MSPLRWDVLLVGFVLAVPVLALGLRGDLSTEEMMTRVLWCLLAGWIVVALIRFATTPRAPVPRPKPEPVPTGPSEAAAAEGEPSPAV
jgi:hypothetical protein